MLLRSNHRRLLYNFFFFFGVVHVVVCINMAPIGSARVAFRRRGLVGVGVALFQEVCHLPSVSLLLLPAEPDVELSATSLALCLPVCHRASCHNNNRINL